MGAPLLHNIDVLMKEKTGLPICVAEEPLLCVALGASKSLEHPNLLKNHNHSVTQNSENPLTIYRTKGFTLIEVVAATALLAGLLALTSLAWSRRFQKNEKKPSDETGRNPAGAKNERVGNPFIKAEPVRRLRKRRKEPFRKTRTLPGDMKPDPSPCRMP